VVIFQGPLSGWIMILDALAGYAGLNIIADLDQQPARLDAGVAM